MTCEAVAQLLLQRSIIPKRGNQRNEFLVSEKKSECHKINTNIVIVLLNNYICGTHIVGAIGDLTEITCWRRRKKVLRA